MFWPNGLLILLFPNAPTIVAHHQVHMRFAGCLARHLAATSGPSAGQYHSAMATAQLLTLERVCCHTILQVT